MIEDVIQALNAKLIRRHPYVFGNDEYPKTAEEQTALWNNIKEEEKTVIRLKQLLILQITCHPC